MQASDACQGWGYLLDRAAFWDYDCRINFFLPAFAGPISLAPRSSTVAGPETGAQPLGTSGESRPLTVLILSLKLKAVGVKTRGPVTD